MYLFLNWRIIALQNFVGFCETSSSTTITCLLKCSKGFPGASVVKNLPANEEDPGSIAGLGRSPGEGNGNPLHSSIFAGKSHGQRSLVGYSPWGHKKSDMTEWLKKFLIGNNSYFYHNLLLGKMNPSCTTPVGEHSWKFAPGFFQISSQVPFSFAICFFSFQCFIVMSTTILMSSPSESSFLGGGTGDNGRGCDRHIDLFTIK